jgi:O-antigen/teichoic acid export membrane protein
MPGSARTLARAGMLVAPATMVANLLGYAFNLAASRGLGPAAYGALAALLGLVLIGLVPAMALQSVIARRTALHAAAAGPEPVHRHVLARALLRTAAVAAVVIAGGAALLTPAVTAFLHLDSAWPFLWVAASLAPLTVAAAVAGILQGGEHFGRLALVTVLPPAARFVGGAAALAAGAEVSGVLAGTALGAVGAMALTLLLVRPVLGTREHARRVPILAELAKAGHGLLALLVLANLDLVLARHYLPAHEAGLYAAGALVTKAAFWLPQFVPIIVFARLTDAERRPAVLRQAVAAELAMGAVMVIGAAVAGTFGIRVLIGAAYAGIGSLAWAFAALGTALALVQLLLFSDIASSSGRMGAAVWGAVVVEIVVIATVAHDGAGQIVGAALLGPACLFALASGRLRRTVPKDGKPKPVLAGPTAG